MIYVIKSIGKEDTNLPVSLSNMIEIIKIGYADDKGIKKRLSSYDTHNKSYDILFLIPEGTQRDERNLHIHFRNLKYKSEWFLVDPNHTIENFFKENTTIENIRSNILNLTVRASGVKNKFYRRLTLILNKNNFIKYKNKINKILKDLVSLGIDNIDEFYKYLSSINIQYDREEVEKIIEEIIKFRSTKEYTKFFNEYEKLSNLYQKLKYLCEYKFKSDEVKHEVLNSITEKYFKEYYEILGPEGCRELGYNITKINKKLGIITFNKDSLIEAIYSSFLVGDKYSTNYIKLTLKDIYISCGYEKSPKASDLEDYFDLKAIKLKDSDGKWVNGFEIIKKK